MKEYEVTITKAITMRSVFIQAEDVEDLDEKINHGEYESSELYEYDSVDYDIDSEEEVEDE